MHADKAKLKGNINRELTHQIKIKKKKFVLQRNM